jgi:hypothetical protein
MSEADVLTSLEIAIRGSVAAECFAETQSLLNRYVAEVERRLCASGGAEEMRALQNRTQSLFQWAAAMLQASREYTASELAQLRSVSRYRNSVAVQNLNTQG